MHFKSLLATLCLLLPFASVAAESSYTADTDYRVIAPAMRVDAAPGKVQVLELFWYGCPHCNHLEPAIQSWLKRKPANVEFVRVPAVFNRTQPDGKPHPWFIHAKAFYAAEALGVGEKIHAPFFDAIHEQNRSLRTEEELAAFFAEHGVAPKEFKDAFNSFTVEAKAANAIEITKQSGISGVPALIVNGKYQVLGKRATSYDDFLAITDYLIARERPAR